MWITCNAATNQELEELLDKALYIEEASLMTRELSLTL
jgi:hypothetical protein